MKTLGLASAVALGLLVGLLWTRDHHSAQRPVQEQSPTPQSPQSPHASATSPVLKVAKKNRPTLEPTHSDPERRKAQETLWQEMRNFATEAKLTDEQWHQFLSDVSELGEMDSVAWANAVRTGDFEGAIEISEDLGEELETRCAAYLTKEQLSMLRLRLNPNGLVTRVRQLHFVSGASPVES